MAEDTGEYRKMLAELIQKQMIMFGPNIALDKARHITGLSVSDDGSILDITGDPQLVLRSLVNEYASLSAPVAQMTLEGLLQKYPNVKNV